MKQRERKVEEVKVKIECRQDRIVEVDGNINQLSSLLQLAIYFLSCCGGVGRGSG